VTRSDVMKIYQRVLGSGQAPARVPAPPDVKR